MYNTLYHKHSAPPLNSALSREHNEQLTFATMTWLTVIEYMCHKWTRIFSTCRRNSRSFPRSWLITGFVARITRRVTLVEQELLTFPEHLSSPPVFSGVRVTRSLVLYVCFVDRCLSFCTVFSWRLCCLFFFDIRILIAPLVSSNFSYA
jgi:hypothetical protein